MGRAVVACFFAGSVVAGLPALAQTAAITTAPSYVTAQATDMMGPAPKGDDPKICRRVTADSPVGGSERLCKTAAEWQRYDQEKQYEAERASRAKAKPKG